MCNAPRNNALYKALLVFGLLASEAGSQLPFAWSKNSLGPLMRAKTPVPTGRRNNVNDITLRFYNGSTPSETTSLRLLDTPRLLNTSGFDPRAPTVLYIHGYIELVTDESVTTVVSAYLEGKPEYNVVVLDWSNMAYGQYVTSAINVRKVGVAMARQVVLLMREPRGLALDRLHLVGHSLGAHIAGQIGRSMRKAGFVLPRISGLDPAFPGFYPELLGAPMRRSDARFTDALHTDAGMYGAPLRTAHVDFWPNGGTGKQPGCDPLTLPFSYEDFCSHHRSWRLWAESVRLDKSFPSHPCADRHDFLRGDCDEPDSRASTGYMGYDATPELRGDYYLTTGSKSPFSQSLNTS